MMSDLEFKISYKTIRDKLYEEVAPSLFQEHPVDELKPVRMAFSTRKQSHTQGFFWISSMRQLVYHESYLERVILMQLDFELRPQQVVAQPCKLHFEDSAHIPDFLVCANDYKFLVDVKYEKKLQSPKFMAAREKTAKASAILGLDYRVYSEPEEIYFANLNWLVGYRRVPPNLTDLAAQVTDSIDASSNTISYADLIAKFEQPLLIKPVIFYMLWHKRLLTDLHRLFDHQMLLHINFDGVENE